MSSQTEMSHIPWFQHEDVLLCNIYDSKFNITIFFNTFWLNHRKYRAATNFFHYQLISLFDDHMNFTFPKWPRPRTATHLKSWRLNWNCSSSLENDQSLHCLHPLWTECPAWSWKYRTILKKTTWQLTSKAWGFKARGQCLHPSYYISSSNTCMSGHYNMNRPRRVSRNITTKTKQSCQFSLLHCC